MPELWRRSEHEPLAGEAWDEGRVEAAIGAIVADTEAACDGARWPWHPADGEDDGSASVYLGAAGVIWALHELGSTGWETVALAQLDRYRAAGVRRISLAGSLYRAAMAAVQEAAREVLERGSFDYLQQSIPTKALNELLMRPR